MAPRKVVETKLRTFHTLPGREFYGKEHVFPGIDHSKLFRGQKYLSDGRRIGTHHHDWNEGEKKNLFIFLSAFPFIPRDETLCQF